ncbi:dirigent protein 1 [Phtheirospermum japonicum]|uniref:Dirigent protein n=1 Tax=Phtheirospermum japonicum TaxID=374723 RepID=A0A830CTH3_9LAMI|nr:dirigent protein 1 [Phtheirospermum japonicum]
MAKLSIILLFSSFFIISFLLPLAYSKTKVTNIRLYLQDTFNTSQPLAYGDVLAFQDPLTVGPDPNSRLLGRAQGTIAFTTLDASLDLHVSIAYIFTSGRYNGSTVVAVGRNDVRQSVRQFPIVGGTGHFKLARGIVTGSTYSTDPAIFIYDLEIFQDYDSPRIEMKYV